MRYRLLPPVFSPRGEVQNTDGPLPPAGKAQNIQDAKSEAKVILSTLKPVAFS